MKLVLLTIGLAGAAAYAEVPEAEPVVTVYASSDAAVPTMVLRKAQHLAGRLFAGAGVQLQWRQGRAPAGANSCRTVLDVRLETDVPGDFRPGALAFANPEKGGAVIRVFYRRVAAIYRPDLAHIVLGYVLAHEIGHVLEGTSRHSGEGILKAQWTPADYKAMATIAFQFAPEDVSRIRRYVSAAVAEGEPYRFQ